MSINAQNITVTYGKKTALDNFSFEFTEEKIYAVLGPNGCGKSTLVKALVNKYANGNIAYVAQETLGVINLTVQEYIELGRYNPGKFFGGLSEEDKNKVMQAIDVMELAGLENRLFDTLSGGEKQRVMAARALAQDALWTILDEPSASLDVKHTSLIMNTVRQLCDQDKKSFIIVLHDINDAARYADEFILMKDGKFVKSTNKLDVEDLNSIYDTNFEKITSKDGRELFYAT